MQPLLVSQRPLRASQSLLFFFVRNVSQPYRLFGVVCSQTYTYLRRYPLDRPFYKVLVGSPTHRLSRATLLTPDIPAGVCPVVRISSVRVALSNIDGRSCAG